MRRSSQAPRPVHLRRPKINVPRLFAQRPTFHTAFLPCVLFTWPAICFYDELTDVFHPIYIQTCYIPRLFAITILYFQRKQTRPYLCWQLSVQQVELSVQTVR